MKNFKLFSHGKNDTDALSMRSMILPIIFCLVCGVLLIAFDQLALRITAYVLSGVMILWGIWQIVAYLRSQPIRRITESKLATGLILLVTGSLLAFNPDYLKEILQYVWGLAVLFGGFLKIQYAFDEKTVKVKKWWIMLIFAAFSLIIGVIAMLKPAFLGESSNLVIGIMLVLEAILDITVFFLLRHALNRHMEEAVPAPQDDAPSGIPVESGPDSVPDSDVSPAETNSPVPETEV